MKFRSLEELRRLLPDSDTGAPAPAGSTRAATRGHDGKGRSVRVVLDRKGRKGKTVTLVTGLQHNPGTMLEIARLLKERCGTGGTVKEGNIELQGDQRERAGMELERMNYIVK